MTLRTIDGYVVDCILDEEVSLSDEVTEYPVESGATFVDHIQLGATEVTITLVVSDTPTGEVAKVRRAGVVYSGEARDFLRKLRADRRPFTFVGTTGTYERMAFTSISEPRDAATGDALVIEATMREIRVAEVRREVVQQVGLGHRPARSVDGPPMWLCPDLLVVSNDPAANAAKKCRRVVMKNGVPHFADTGEQLTIGEVGQLEKQRYAKIVDENGNGVISQNRLAWDKDRGFVNRTTYAQGGKFSTVDTPLTAAQRAKVAEFEAQEARRREADRLGDEIFGGSQRPNGLSGSASIFR